MPARTAASDLVLDAKLDTEFFDSCIRHTRFVQGPSARERRTRIREVWDIGRIIGRGSFGSVRIESCRTMLSGQQSQSRIRQRAVKKISKDSRHQGRWDYLKELETVIKFSHERYAPHFVRTEGWFENSEDVFITLEYLPLGDLQHFMKNSPAFDEEAVRRITGQLLEGIAFMHDSGFAHRDLKPGNILVEAASPDWLVKIADFGISKRAQEGGTDLRTMQIGTFGYMAPEVMGFFSGNDPSVAYSVTVDIWAIGIIAYELLFKRHPFVNVKDILDYVTGAEELRFSGRSELGTTEVCLDFLRSLLTPNPVTRPTAGAANNHSWFGREPSPMDTEEPLFVEEASVPDGPMAAFPAATPASVAWSASQLNGGTQTTATLMPTYQGHHLDASILIPAFRHLDLERLDVETSAAHGVWTSSQRVNNMLNKAYLKTGGRVVLFFSVIKSRKLCGVAQMTSEMDWDNTDEHWFEDAWSG
ncbi:calcium/calmodulin-dependent protein kinase [Emericellopsis atlantica]|uniref:non-specific serine/threonine protein kinase n=1 Tax=Emericellopsis atlantica TaxID=2614577 RepID=A0A9P7ZNQ6_9HYPO|nr:calcium/calmodulin-dependent protein kinase [Emericellopsis atlantica]KAG9255484.1 calcium/calmodulin-dependent protein kinase [Emericellopsis atlantica]